MFISFVYHALQMNNIVDKLKCELNYSECNSQNLPQGGGVTFTDISKIATHTSLCILSFLKTIVWAQLLRLCFLSQHSHMSVQPLSAKFPCMHAHNNKKSINSVYLLVRPKAL